MALSSSPIASPVAGALVVDTNLGAAADNDVRAGATTLYAADIDNTANAAATYVKFYNTAAPTVGTTAPDAIVYVPASTRLTSFFGLAGTAFAHLSFAAVTTGGTAGTTAPSSAVKINILCT